MACHLLPPIDLLTYYSLTCWLVDSLTFKKNRCKLGFNGFNRCENFPSQMGETVRKPQIVIPESYNLKV